MPHEPGEWVRLLKAEYGTAQGPSAGEHGDGEMREVPGGAACEIFAVERNTGWLTLHFELEDSGPREPFRVELIASSEDVEPAGKPPYKGWGGEMPDPPPDL